jgi:hypothetical protein
MYLVAASLIYVAVLDGLVILIAPGQVYMAIWVQHILAVNALQWIFGPKHGPYTESGFLLIFPVNSCIFHITIIIDFLIEVGLCYGLLSLILYYDQ